MIRHLCLASAAVWLAAAPPLAAQNAPAAPSKGVVRTVADLPQARYPVPEAPSRYVFTDAFLKDLVPRLRADAEAALANNTFVEASLQRQIASSLAAIAVLQGRSPDAVRYIREQRAREVQPQLQRLGLLTWEAMAVMRAAPPAEACEAGAQHIAGLIKGADPVTARQEVASRWSQVQLSSRAFEASGLQRADTNAAKLGGVSLLEGLLMARVRLIVDTVPPCREALSAPLRAWLDDPANAEADIWPAREPAPASFAGAAPVTVAVWDSGLDTTLFAGSLARDPAEPLDGIDNDGNGVVDDVHGPTFGADMLPSDAPMQPLSAPLAERYLAAATLAQGQADHYYGLDTPHARLFTLYARSAPTEDQAIQVLLEGELGFRGHGTFIGSQIAEGLPFVRLYNMRVFPFAMNPEPTPITEVEVDRWIAQLGPSIQRMRAAGVRVANLSWGYLDDGGEGLLETGAETDPERARARTRAMYDKVKAAMLAAFAAAPEILFVSAAGNDGSRSEDIGSIPDTLGLANHINVGAVGPGGGPASFTSFGKGMKLYANGGRARGKAPGGGWDNASGTSMAAPLVVRAAAQMLAVNPKLTTAQLIEGLHATATPNAQGLALLDPKAATAWARARRAP